MTHRLSASFNVSKTLPTDLIERCQRVLGVCRVTLGVAEATSTTLANALDSASGRRWERLVEALYYAHRQRADELSLRSAPSRNARALAINVQMAIEAIDALRTELDTRWARESETVS